ncbi:MAG: type II toxin-antitoxin system VapC family toxin [Nitrosomonadales bacterium]|nr:type II toxin-antitoxin system VapC family toxin [Nitrosomonadales bacterium]
MVYADTSVIAPLLTAEPKTQAVIAWFAGLRDAPTCSDWLLAEFYSALSIKLRTGQISEANAKRVRKEFEALAGGGLRIVPVSRSAFKQAAKMVQQHAHGLRAGDSLHLAVALELEASHMATLDSTLAANAKRNRIKLIEF